MSWIDYTIMAIVVASIAIGVWRGFIREMISLGVWIAAFIVSYMMAGTVEVYFADLIADKGIRMLVAFMAVFVVVHLFGFVLAQVLSRFIKAIGLTAVDRTAGAGFGLARGMIMVSVLVLLVGLTPMAEAAQWQQSPTVGAISKFLVWVQDHYPLERVSDVLAQMGVNL